MNVVVHQRRSIGARAMVGMGAAVTHDVPPFSKVFGVPLRLHGANTVGMTRAGIPQPVVDVVAASLARGESDVSLQGLPGGTDPMSPELASELASELAWWAAVHDRRPVPAPDPAGQR